MKKLFIILLAALALVALDLVFPRAEIEAQIGSFLKNNLSRVVSWVNFGALA